MAKVDLHSEIFSCCWWLAKNILDIPKISRVSSILASFQIIKFQYPKSGPYNIVTHKKSGNSANCIVSLALATCPTDSTIRLRIVKLIKFVQIKNIKIVIFVIIAHSFIIHLWRFCVHYNKMLLHFRQMKENAFYISISYQFYSL